MNAAVAAEAERGADLLRPRRRRRLQRLDPGDRAARRRVVGIHGGGDPQRAIGIRDAVVAGLTDGSIADRAARTRRAAGAAPSCSWAAGRVTRG